MKYFEEHEETNKIIGPAELVSNLFKQFEEPEVSEPSRAISPSSLSCPIACAFKLTGKPVLPHKESFQSRSFADNGSDRHERIQEFLSSTPYWTSVADYIRENKIPLEILDEGKYETLLYSDEFKSRFKCDGMLKIDGQYYILEIKTERQEANNYREGPDPKHQLQGLAYSRMLNIPRIMWVYEGRNALEQKTFLQVVTDEEKDYISKYLKDIVDNADTPENLPKNGRACPYCDYKPYCKEYFKSLKKEN